MDSALACCAGGPGSIPAVGKSIVCNIQMVFLPLGIRWQDKIMEPDTRQVFQRLHVVLIRILLAMPSKCEEWYKKIHVQTVALLAALENKYTRLLSREVKTLYYVSTCTRTPTKCPTENATLWHQMFKPPNSLDKSILQDCLNAVQNALYRTLLSKKFEYFSLKGMCKKTA